jgi:hypothetical protein
LAKMSIITIKIALKESHPSLIADLKWSQYSIKENTAATSEVRQRQR